jgi:hypothetical protein
MLRQKPPFAFATPHEHSREMALCAKLLMPNKENLVIVPFYSPLKAQGLFP